MGMGRYRPIHLTKDERTDLGQLIKSGTHPAQTIVRACTLLLLDRSQGQNRTTAEVKEAALVSQGTIHNLKQRYFAAGLPEALHEKPRSGRPVTKWTGDVKAHLIALACSDPPEGYERFILRLLADRLVQFVVVDSISSTPVPKKLKITNVSLGK
jgi:hypothetical protein